MMHRMKKMILSLTALALLATPAIADARKKRAKSVAPLPAPAAAVLVKPVVYPSPPEIVAAAPAGDWVAIAPSDLLVMDLAPLGDKPRRVVIQLMPAPFSQGWVGNIRKLAAAHFWDGTAIVRVQDNYVTQWGDPDGEDSVKAKKLPDGLVSVLESEYSLTTAQKDALKVDVNVTGTLSTAIGNDDDFKATGFRIAKNPQDRNWQDRLDVYGWPTAFAKGWPVSADPSTAWPTHCYGMVGVGRNLSPDTGTGAELYTVIGHAPRHLDRNIALVGRIIEGMEHMSSLPRGTGALGFYEKPEERTAILSVSLMSEMGNDKTLPTYEYLSTESASFAKYADARTNRRDPFFIKPAGGADICNIPVPVRRRK
jgi:cyclophilin family peptidyl-prolyl cis-trans isomerase